jgi:hypothetical protein
MQSTTLKPQIPSAPARNQLIVRQALLVGVVLGAVDLLRTLIEGPNGLTAATPGALGVAAFLLIAAGFVYLGVRSASQTARVRSGALAGLIAGLVVWAFYVIAALAMALPNQEALRRQFQTVADQAHAGIHYSTAAALATVIVSLALAIFPGAGVGAALGAVGGVLGRRQARRAAPSA